MLNPRAAPGAFRVQVVQGAVSLSSEATPRGSFRIQSSSLGRRHAGRNPATFTDEQMVTVWSITDAPRRGGEQAREGRDPAGALLDRE